ncbi:MAG: UDP-N-acetylmuramoyl-tripeptide--D-alanyl-D-alanine ligase [Candidatus Paceibacterota bacterium]
MISLIKKLISRYSYKYPKSLTYMLQASEYNFSDFIEWYKKVNDFSKVEKRKALIPTKKALGIMLMNWGLLIFVYGFGIWVFFNFASPDRYFGLLVIVFAPYLIPYLLFIPLTILKIFIQKPIEYFLLKKAKEKISKHKGIKIGIAGSYGKTTMREILKTSLSIDKKVAAPPHSYNTPLGIAKFIKTLDGDEDVLIFELGEYYPGDIQKLCKIIKPDIGIITGINEAHLKKFKTIENTVDTIYEIKDFVRSENLYVNGESELAKNNAPKDSILYSGAMINDWNVHSKENDLNGIKFNIEKDDLDFEIKSKLIGLHQTGPLALAFYLSQKLGITADKAVEGISKVKPFDHRLEPKNTGKITLIDDSYNGNPDGVEAAINFLSSLENKRRFYVTPGLVEMGEKSEEIHKEIGKQLAKADIEKVILIKNSVTPFIEQGLKENDYKGDIIWFEDGPKAFNSIDILTIKDDVVLIQNDWPDQYQ